MLDKLASSYPRVIVELGMGDGRLLEALAKHDSSSLYVGIDLDNAQCKQAQSSIALSNVIILSGSFEDIVPTFPDGSVDRFIAVLPDPEFIDEKKEGRWKPFYKEVYSKLKPSGTLELVTEITDELLRPVSDEAYVKWVAWLRASFLSIGFDLTKQHEGAPAQYSSRCLDQFRGDPERIRMVTLELAKR
ncbi:MAG: methyltransferase domain-containing protein [Nitrososphaera sp.]|uniref:tRNA (guanine(46)-N(7))-methyltransferase n=1 Tax=Nitrososphaera gargensis (strain Ga9.2) TaxID=1237085 RepID=K0ILF7_NITGG|nr:methyltransferase domain-containing protein [Candidatus Nitrososphaera gargensis]AFU59467.1 putative tRNA (guanine-N(7)-)-methyltransferase [Candidatus Nitrososphaera gargensis Ga9.2]